jgi:rod shape-determining protein MreD
LSEKRIPLLFPFFLALAAAAYASVFLSHIHLHTFAPFLALLYSRCSRVSSFWISALCGLLMDLLASEMRFGIYSLSFSIATLLLYHQKKHFYQEKPLALSLFTFQLSLVITGALFFFSIALHPHFSFNAKSIIADFFLMSLADALYAFLWFSCPMMLYRHIYGLKRDFLFSKIKTLVENMRKGAKS